LVAFEATGEPRIRQDEVCAVELEPPVGYRKLAVEKRLAKRPAHRELGIEPTGGAIDLRHKKGQRRERLGRAVQPSSDGVLPHRNIRNAFGPRLAPDERVLAHRKLQFGADVLLLREQVQPAAAEMHTLGAELVARY